MTEEEKHEILVDYVNELMAKNGRLVVGVSTSQDNDEDDINSITIRIAPNDGDE